MFIAISKAHQVVGEPLAGLRPRDRPRLHPETRPRRGRSAIAADSTSDELAALVRCGDRPALEAVLVAGSHLPGSRANLALARRLGVEASTLPTAALIALVSPWLALTLDEAPVDAPAEFLPACASVALGSRLPSSDVHLPPLEPLLERAARDPRWRTREGLVVGLRVAGERDVARLLAFGERWMATGDPYLMRTVVTTLAHPPILQQPSVAETALRHARTAVDRLQSQPPGRRSTEGSRILTESLGSALSAYIAAAPGPGFQLLDDLLAGGDRATRRIVNRTLGDARLANALPTQVTRLKGWIYEMDDWQRG